MPGAVVACHGEVARLFAGGRPQVLDALGQPRDRKPRLRVPIPGWCARTPREHAEAAGVAVRHEEPERREQAADGALFLEPGARGLGLGAGFFRFGPGGRLGGGLLLAARDGGVAPRLHGEEEAGHAEHGDGGGDGHRGAAPVLPAAHAGGGKRQLRGVQPCGAAADERREQGAPHRVAPDEAGLRGTLGRRPLERGAGELLPGGERHGIVVHLVDPADEAAPAAHERIVRGFGVAGAIRLGPFHDEPRGGQPRQHVLHTRALSRIRERQLGVAHATFRQTAGAAVHHAQHQVAHRLLVRAVEGVELGIGPGAQGTDDAADGVVVGLGQRAIGRLAADIAAVHLAQRERQQRQAAGCVHDIVEQCLDERRRVEVEHARRGWLLDDRLEVGAAERRHDVAAVFPQRAECRPVELRLEVGAQRQHDGELQWMLVEQPRQERRHRIARRGGPGHRDEFLALVHEQQQALAGMGVAPAGERGLDAVGGHGRARSEGGDRLRECLERRRAWAHHGQQRPA